MKILIINDFIVEYGGPEKGIIIKKKFFEGKGHSVELFGSKKIIRNKFTILNFKYYFKLKKKIREFKPDLILIHNIRFFLSPLILFALPKSIPKIITIHDYGNICPKIWNIDEDKQVCKRGIGFRCIYKKCLSSKKRNIFYEFLRYLKVNFLNYSIIKKVDIIITPSKLLSKKIRTKFKLTNVFTIRNPQKLIRNQYINKGKYYLYVGRLEKEKGIFFLLKNFQLFLNKFPKEKLIIIGDGKIKKEIKKYIEINNLKKNIIIKDFMTFDNLHQYYFNAKCVLVPSIWVENFSNVVLESLIDRTPLLVNLIGGLKEQSKIFLNVNTYKYNNSIDFIKKLEYCQNTKKKSFKKDLELIKKDFSLEKYYNEIIKHYNKIN